MEEHKLVMLGSGGVGKSAVTLQFIKSEFDERYNPTIEDAYTKQLYVDDKVTKLHVLDTAGQEEYSALRDTYMRDGEGFILVFSLTDPSSLHEVCEIHRQLLRSKDCEEGGVPIVVIANKIDLPEERAITQEECKRVIQSFGKRSVKYFEASAKKNVNVTEAFHEIVRMIRNPEVEEEEQEEPSIKEEQSHTKKKRSGLFSSISNHSEKSSDLNNIKNIL